MNDFVVVSALLDPKDMFHSRWTYKIKAYTKDKHKSKDRGFPEFQYTFDQQGNGFIDLVLYFGSRVQQSTRNLCRFYLKSKETVLNLDSNQVHFDERVEGHSLHCKLYESFNQNISRMNIGYISISEVLGFKNSSAWNGYLLWPIGKSVPQSIYLKAMTVRTEVNLSEDFKR